MLKSLNPNPKSDFFPNLAEIFLKLCKLGIFHFIQNLHFSKIEIESLKKSRKEKLFLNRFFLNFLEIQLLSIFFVRNVPVTVMEYLGLIGILCYTRWFLSILPILANIWPRWWRACLQMLTTRVQFLTWAYFLFQSSHQVSASVSMTLASPSGPGFESWPRYFLITA